MSLQRSARDPRLNLDERLKILYPMVNEEETPLPRCWSVKDKFNYIGLSQVSCELFHIIDFQHLICLILEIRYVTLYCIS